MRVLIQTSKTGPFVDYTRYVIDGSLSIEDSINVPTLISFQLASVDNAFVVPKRSSYIQIISDVFSPGGGYGSGKLLATGFITNEPERQFLGVTGKVPGQHFIQYQYNISVTSDEWLLNCNSVPWIPAFVNQTDSQILAAIAQALMPGVFDTSQMAPGVIVPFFQYDPSQTWSDIAKTFGDANRYHYKVINKQIIYQPFGDLPLGISYDEQNQRESQLNPTELKTNVVNVPPVNDCIVIGDVEPQTNWDNYFVGDGFTSNFPLRHQVFQGTSSKLLSDDWTETQLTQGTWIENDPQGQITLVDGNGNALGALNVVQFGSPGTYLPIQNATYIQAQNGLELGGGLNLQHGQFTFNNSCNGLVGSVFATSNFIPGNVLCGFGITGQQGAGPFTVTTVQRNANSNIATLVIPSAGAAVLQPGNVLQCSLFSNATFLNGTKVQVLTNQQVAINRYSVNVLMQTTFAAAYGPTLDSGQVVAVVGDVLLTASGCAGVIIQPILSGQYVGQPVISQINHQYVLQTWIGAQAPTRFTRPYTNLTRTTTYGAQNLAASGTITWVITDYNLGVYVIEQQNPLFGLFPAAPPPVVTKYSAGPNLFLPPFAVYCLLNGINLNISVNYTVFSEPPQGFLTAQSLTGMSGGNLPWLPSQLSVPITYQLGFGMINQTAQISLQGEVFELSFYTDDIPSVGSRIRFQSWSAGQSVARVRDTVAIANEAVISGDSGVRGAIMQNLSPIPRTSAECEAAAGAAILDREFPQFQGTYTVETVPHVFENLYAPSLYGSYPRTGEFFYINAPTRAITGQNFFTNTVRIQVLELRQEVLSISVDYGPDLYLEKMLPSFLEREQNLLVPTQQVPPPNPITIGQVLNAYLPTLDNAQIVAQVNGLSGNYVVVDLGAPPITGCEVRNVDSGWGTATQGRVGLFTTQVFTLPRTVRDQTWYLRTLNGSQFSRYSKALRVVAPLIPSSPALVSSNADVIVAGLNGDVRDIYGIEMRALAASGLSGAIFIQIPNTNPEIPQFNFIRQPNNSPGFGFGTGVLSSSLVPVNTGTNVRYQTGIGNFNIGDIVYAVCNVDSSFNGLRILGCSGIMSLGIGHGNTPIYETWEYGQPFPDTQTGATAIGTIQLVNRGYFANVISGSLINNVATVVTQVPHNLTVGQYMVLGAAYPASGAVTFIPPFSQSFFDSAVFSTAAIVTSIIDAHTFTYTIVLPNGGGVQNCPLVGLVAQIPQSLFNQTFFIPGAAPGTILQRPVFSPQDLVIDLTQPDIASTLKVLESVTPGSRVGGLAIYFFNLTWDYSVGTVIPSFNIPSISGLTVVNNFQGLTWQLQTGLPDGHRVETFDINSGVLYSKYTIDHPFNPQLLLQSNLPTSDFVSPRIIKVTPFDSVGDGIPSFITWLGASGGLGAPNPAGYTIGCTFNGTIPPNFVLVRIPLDEAIQFFTNFIPSQGYLETAPTSTLTLTIYKRSVGTLTDVAIGTMTFAPGANIATFSLSGVVVFRAGDVLKLVSPNSVDATAQNFGCTLSATQYFGT